MKRLLTLVMVLAVLSTATSAATIHVPADQTSIQAGIDAASTGDTILVAAGTYTGSGNRDIDFGGKVIIVRSADGPGTTLIDCQGSELEPHRGFRFHSGETGAAVLQGFTILNGNAPGDVAPAPWPMGGAICCDNSSPTISNCRFVINQAVNGGGGVAAVWGAHPVIKDCEFRQNTTTYGGGLYCWQNASPTVQRCVFEQNATYADGGGADCAYSSSPTFSYCLFSENSAVVGGGMMCYNNSNPVLTNCTFARNSAPIGGGINCNNSVPTLHACIIANSLSGEAISCYYSPGALVLTCCDVFGNAGGDWTGCIGGLQEANGNLALDPRFCDLPSGKYTIRNNSPCAPRNNGCGVLIGFGYVACSYLCGDANGDQKLNIADAVCLIIYLISGGPTPQTLASADATCDGVVDMADVVYMLHYIFTGGPAPCATCK
jgi:hypothetical protein